MKQVVLWKNISFHNYFQYLFQGPRNSMQDHMEAALKEHLSLSVQKITSLSQVLSEQFYWQISVVPRVFYGHTGTYIYCVLKRNWRIPTMVWDPVRKCFRILSVWISLKFTSQPCLRSFYKPYFKKSGFNVWASIQIQGYKNTCGYDTGNIMCNFPVLSYFVLARF